MRVDDLDCTGIHAHELTDKELDGTKREPHGIWKVLFQLEGFLVHCKEGIDRSAMITAAILLAVYHETELSVEDAIEYLLAVRPVFDFRVHKPHGDPVVMWGGQLGNGRRPRSRD